MIDKTVTRHFDRIAENYHQQIGSHIRDHLIEKWWRLVCSYFPENAYVLDVGCGDGSNVRFLRLKSVNAIGIDASRELLETGKCRYLELKNSIFEGDACNLDFRDGTFDVVYMIGLLHHIDSRGNQKRAIEEGLRVVKKGGHVIIRESSLRNPLFWLFWNYVFPMTSKIDKFGGENWVSPAFFKKENFEIDQLSYFTFLPNFTPGFLLPAASRLESYLERSILKPLSAHYTIVLKRS